MVLKLVENIILKESLNGSKSHNFRPELKLQQLIRIGLEYGDPDLLSHTLLHAYPLHG